MITSPKGFPRPPLTQTVVEALGGQDDHHVLAAYLSSRAALAYQDPAVSKARISDVRRRIVDWIEKLPADSRNLVLTGHSLGGALAVMAAFDLARSFPVRFVFTFGQPRVGLLIFGKYYRAQSCGPEMPEKLGEVTRRYMRETDLVPRVPPRVLYWHVGSPWLLDSAGNCSQGRPKEAIRRFEDAYYDLEFQSTLSSGEKIAAPQYRDWHEALESRTPQSAPSPPKVDPARQVLNAQSEGPRFILWGETWKRLFSNLHWLIAVPASVIGIMISVIMFWSYKRDLEAHSSLKYVAAFHNKYPLLFCMGDVD